MNFDHSMAWLFFPLLFLVAFLYASVGHGGASGYLALLALFSIEPSMMKSSALILNIFVSFISFFQYYNQGYFRWKLFMPFAITSIPASFIGALIVIDGSLYKKILGVCLIFPILKLMGLIGKENDGQKELKFVYGCIVGMLIGLISGMIGIGGGIILSPVILLFHWAKMKETAAVSALFIFVNSIAGLIALFTKGILIDSQVYLWLTVALAGGLLGAYYGSKKFDSAVLKYILSFVLLIASIKLLLV